MHYRYLALALLAPLGASAADQPQPAVAGNDAFTLGEVTVLAPMAQTLLPSGDSLTQQDLRQHDQERLGQALNLLPGVHTAYSGARGEQLFYVRGFDRLQVPIYIDGVPTYVPYDGRIDLGHFTSYDLARVEVTKGFSPLTYGPNALGGAINLITRQPTRAFEGEVGGGLGLSARGRLDSRRAYANLGGRQAQWWYQIGASHLKTSSFELPGDFAPHAQQPAGRRVNSLRQDSKLSAKIGLTPNASDEYVLGLVRQDGEKGQPTYAGSLPLRGQGSRSRTRYWQWPQWDKTSYYFSSRTQLGGHSLKARLFHDRFANTLVGYDYRNGVVGGVQAGFPSRYDDHSNGLSLEADMHFWARQRTRLAYHLKQDVHRSSDDGTPWTLFKDRTQSLALEHSATLGPGLTAVAGLAYHQRKSLSARNHGTHAGSPEVPGLYEEPRGQDDAVDAQLGLYQDLGQQARWGQLRASVASKSRFATMMERYSTRFGRVIPNPDLKSERARHYELGYGLQLPGQWAFDAAVFRSDVRDSIQNVTVPAAQCSSTSCEQPQNVARARHSGLELSLHGGQGPWSMQANYTLLRRKNLSAPDVFATDTPRHKLFAAGSWAQGPWTVTASVEAASQRHSASNGKQIAAGFAVYNLKGGYRLGNGAELELGVRNLGDRLYAYSEGYPMPGRNYFVQVRYPF
ncbi:TonB-dependent receptor [Vandammella animalimorsus]|uniref:TonB-dependent receptor n=1 Tax=Vandammella animalimorsus TaxID=2029117 RepID=A0A2A2AQB1_9BURK|nr:TonB-dependent receptor [Vandammella animalimorsus]PAT39943.1 TonB-dependent receptor [Vandammella animalimorsus]